MQMDQPGGESKFLTLWFFGLFHAQNRAVSFAYKNLGIISVSLVYFLRKRSLADGQVRNDGAEFSDISTDDVFLRPLDVVFVILRLVGDGLTMPKLSSIGMKWRKRKHVRLHASARAIVTIDRNFCQSY